MPQTKQHSKHAAYQRWAVILDGAEYSTWSSLDDANRSAHWLWRHPAVVDRRRFRLGGSVSVADRYSAAYQD